MSNQREFEEEISELIKIDARAGLAEYAARTKNCVPESRLTKIALGLLKSEEQEEQHLDSCELCESHVWTIRKIRKSAIPFREKAQKNPGGAIAMINFILQGDVCKHCDANLDEYPFCAKCGSNNPHFDEKAFKAEVGLTVEQRRLSQCGRNHPWRLMLLYSEPMARESDSFCDLCGADVASFLDEILSQQ